MTQQGPTRTSRRRSDRRDRHRMLIVAIMAVAVVLGVGSIIVALETRPDASSTVQPGPPEGPPATLGMFAVQDDPSLVAVVGVAPGRDSVVMPIPHDVLVPLPVTGSGTIGDAVRLSGQSGRSAVANLIGAWLPHYAYVDMEGLGRIVDQAGGIQVKVPRVRLGERTVGPGEVKLRGADVIAYLSVREPGERSLRWQEVSAGLFAQPLELDDRSVVATDDLEAAAKYFTRVHDAIVEPLPAEVISVGLEQAMPDEVAEAMADAFGIIHGEPTRVIVLNGNASCSGCGQIVTDAIVPHGYQASAYGDEVGRHQKTTLVLSATRELLPQAEQIREALGVGRVMLTRGRSGLGDLTVIVGSDLLGDTAPTSTPTPSPVEEGTA